MFMIHNGMEWAATITEGIAGCLSLGYILGQTSVDRALAGAADIAGALRGNKIPDNNPFSPGHPSKDPGSRR